MTPNKTELSMTDMSLVQFHKWLRVIVDELLFAERDKLVDLLAQEADREVLANGFRQLFESYSYDFAFELDTQEEDVLNILEVFDEYSYLKRRIDAVLTEQKLHRRGK